MPEGDYMRAKTIVEYAKELEAKFKRALYIGQMMSNHLAEVSYSLDGTEHDTALALSDDWAAEFDKEYFDIYGSDITGKDLEKRS